MKGETQALHLAKMMKHYIHKNHYELALPLMTVRSSKLKKLSVKDVLLLDLDVLEFVLIEEKSICAELILKNVSDTHVVEIIKLDKRKIETNDNNKYEILKFSLGECTIKDLKVGSTIDIAEFDFNEITLIMNDKKMAEGSFVTIDKKIAVKINKVMQ